MCINEKEQKKDYTEYLPYKIDYSNWRYIEGEGLVKGVKQIDWESILNIKCKSTSRGVYVFLYKGEIIYVGKTSYLRQRIKQHFRSTNVEFSKFLCMNYKDVEVFLIDNRDRLDVEAQYIHLLRPKFNRTI